MKVTVTAGNLGQGLQVVSRAVSSRTTLPILNNVLLQTADTGLQLTATNLEIGIRQVIPAEVQEEGGITVPARLLTDFVTAHPDEPLSMTLDRKTQSLAVKSNRFDANIRGIDPADFPPVPAGAGGGEGKGHPAPPKGGTEQNAIAPSRAPIPTISSSSPVRVRRPLRPRPRNCYSQPRWCRSFQRTRPTSSSSKPRVAS